METLIDRTKRYFELFSTKNVKGLENEIYSETVELKDWNGIWKGKFAVLEMNESLFNNEIFVEVLDIKVIENRTYCKIVITINNDDLTILDVIDWDEFGKISKIEAFDGTLR